MPRWPGGGCCGDSSLHIAAWIFSMSCRRNDSKQLTATVGTTLRRYYAARVAVSVGMGSVELIDSRNILQRPNMPCHGYCSTLTNTTTPTA